MRKSHLFTSLAIFAAQTHLNAHDDWSLNNHWNVSGDFVYLKRNELHRKDIVYDSSKIIDLVNHPESDQSVMSTKRLINSFEFEPGYRVTLSYTKNKRSTVEATFMTAAHWSSSHSVYGDGTLSFPFNNPNYTNDFFMADRAKAEYQSKFYNAELNAWRHFTPRRGNYFSVSGIFGARYFQIDEKFNLAFFKDNNQSDYLIHTWNYMAGLQIGLNLQVNPMKWFSWEFTGKVGEFVNGAKQKTFLGDDNNSLVLHQFRRWGVNGVFFADVEGMLTFQWTANVNVHAGYKFMYLNGVVLAPNQIDKGTSHNSGKRINDGGQIYIQGLVAGLNLGF